MSKWENCPPSLAHLLEVCTSIGRIPKGAIAAKPHLIFASHWIWFASVPSPRISNPLSQGVPSRQTHPSGGPLKCLVSFWIPAHPCQPFGPHCLVNTLNSEFPVKLSPCPSKPRTNHAKPSDPWPILHGPKMRDSNFGAQTEQTPHEAPCGPCGLWSYVCVCGVFFSGTTSNVGWDHFSEVWGPGPHAKKPPRNVSSRALPLSLSIVPKGRRDRAGWPGLANWPAIGASSCPKKSQLVVAEKKKWFLCPLCTSPKGKSLLDA